MPKCKFPTIDYAKCFKCLMCADLCSYIKAYVFVVEKGKPIIKNPECCKLDCVLCKKSCPAGAIEYTEHGHNIVPLA